jgi:hypothetical protein
MSRNVSNLFVALISQSGCKSTTSFLSRKSIWKFFRKNTFFFNSLNLLKNLAPFGEGKDNYFFISSKFFTSKISFISFCLLFNIYIRTSPLLRVQKYNLNPLWQVFFEFILQLFLNWLIPRFVNTKVFCQLRIVKVELEGSNNENSIKNVKCWTLIGVFSSQTALGIAAKSPQRSEDL